MFGWKHCTSPFVYNLLDVNAFPVAIFFIFRFSCRIHRIFTILVFSIHTSRPLQLFPFKFRLPLWTTGLWNNIPSEFDFYTNRFSMSFVRVTTYLNFAWLFRIRSFIALSVRLPLYAVFFSAFNMGNNYFFSLRFIHKSHAAYFYRSA